MTDISYLYKAGNIRVSIDTGIRTSAGPKGFLDPESPVIPSANAIILEVKFDSFLPDIIRDAIQISSRRETEFSKYVVSRLM